MDKNDVSYWLKVYAKPVFRTWHIKQENIPRICDEIVAAHEQDKADALKVQDATWRDIVGEKLDEIASLKARLAVMAEALRLAHEYEGILHRYNAQRVGLDKDKPPVCARDLDMTLAKATDAKEKALESAPRVLFHEVGRTAIYNPGWMRILLPNVFEFEAWHRFPTEEGQLFDVIVLPRPEQNGEETKSADEE